MQTAVVGELVERVREAAGAPRDQAGLSDRELLAAHLAAPSGPAFAALVQRHGPLVWRVCRRAAGRWQDAEDAFQATFLVLARRAGQVAWGESVAGWLHAVARRVAARARGEAAPAAGGLTGPRTTPDERTADPLDALGARELLGVVDEEVGGLPGAVRGPVVLCLLEGLTQEEAAGRLGVSLSTLRRRLGEGRELLRGRLSRRGLGECLLPALGGLLPREEPAAALLQCAATGGCSVRALALAGAAASRGAPARWLLVAGACLAMGVGVALGALPGGRPGAPGAPPARAVAPPPRDDSQGDPLPPGALLRLGSIRFRHRGGVMSVAWSADGRQFASAGWSSKRVLLWDRATGRELGELGGRSEGYRAVAWSPDGKQLAAVGNDSVVHLWDLPARSLRATLPDRAKLVTHIAFVPGRGLVAADQSGVRLWDGAPGGKVASVLDREGEVGAFAVAPDGRRLALGADRVVHLLDLSPEAGRKGRAEELRGHDQPVQSLTFGAGGRTLLSAGVDRTLAWDLATGKSSKMPGPAEGPITQTSLSPSGRLVATVTGKGVLVREVGSGKLVSRGPLHSERTNVLTFAPDDRSLATVSDGGVIQVRDTRTGEARPGLPGHQERLTGLACSPDGRTVASVGWDGVLRLWDLADGKELDRIDLTGNPRKGDSWNPASLGAVSWSPDGRLLAVVRGDLFAVVYDRALRKEVLRFPTQCVAFSPDGKWLASGERGTTAADANAGIVRLYELPSGALRREIRGHLTTLASIQFAADGRTVYTTGHRMFGLRTGEPGESETRFSRRWDVRTGRELRPVGGESAGIAAVSPDGRFVARTDGLGGKSGVRVIEVATGETRTVLSGHEDMVFAVAFAPGTGNAPGPARGLVASAGMDGTVRLWDLMAGREVARLEGHRSWALCLSFTPDGRKLVSGSLDSSALVWDLTRIPRAGPPAAPLGREDREACWKDLAGPGESAHRAVARLAARRAEALDLLAARARPVAPVEPARLARLIGELGSESFDAREQALKDLAALGELAVPALTRVEEGATDLELRRRARRLLDAIERGALPPDQVRLLRAVEVLESLGGPEARALLRKLAAGAPGARVTREAGEALRRTAERR